MYKKLLCPCIVLYIAKSIIVAQSGNPEAKKIFQLEASYIGDQVNNLHGGLKTGSAYLGMANIKVGFSFENAGLWKGGQLYINAANTHGSQPSARLTGDLQVISNIEAGNHTYIQEFWFKQTFGSIELTAGLQDLNVEFANTDHGSLFMNSSFGIMPTISCNIPAPIFPLTTLGLSLNWQMSGKTRWLTAIYDGCPTDFEDNPHNVRWELNSKGGALVVSEFQYAVSVNNLPGNYKAGFFTHHHYSIPEDVEIEAEYVTNYGFYTLVDQSLWQNATGSKGFGMFVQLSLSPAKYSQNYYYTGIGFNYSGLLNKQGNDVLGLAVAHAGLKGNALNETTLELTYNIPVTKYLFVQPDLQYIFNPAGGEERPDNCLAASVRFGITL